MKKVLVAAVFLVFLLSFAAFTLADFAQTTVYFTVPTAISFTVTFPLSTVTNASSGSSPGPATADINFTSASGTSLHLEPCLSTAFGGACQAGAPVPIFSYKNTGNVNISMWLEFNDTLPTGVAVGVNSTVSGTGNNAIVHTALYDVNNSEWVEAFQHLNTSSNQYVNVTLYSNFTSVEGGMSVRLLFHNSTRSG